MPHLRQKKFLFPWNTYGTPIICRSDMEISFFIKDQRSSYNHERSVETFGGLFTVKDLCRSFLKKKNEKKDL